MILLQQGPNLWGGSPECRLPASLLSSPQMEQIIQLLWVKQGNIHFRKERERREDRKKTSGRVCLLWKQFEQTEFSGLISMALLSCFTFAAELCTSSQHLYQLWFPPLFSVKGQILRGGGGGSFGELKDNRVTRTLRITGANCRLGSHLCCEYHRWQRWRQQFPPSRGSNYFTRLF